MLSKKPWNLERLLHLMLGILFCILGIIGTQGAVQHFVGKNKFEEGSLLYLVFGSMALHGSILVSTIFVLFLNRLKWSETFGFNSLPLGRAILLGLAAALVFMPAGMALQDVSLMALDRFHVHTETQQAVAEFEKADSSASRAYLVFFAVVFAPIVEEMFFRGTLYPAIKQFGFPRWALWSSSLIFAAVHGSAAIFLPLLLLSFVLVWLYEKTDNLLAPITAHAVFNGINVLLLFFSDSLTETFQRVFPHLR